MTRSEKLASNAGIDAVVEIAAASAKERKLTEMPTRYNFACAALKAIAKNAWPFQSCLLVPAASRLT